MDGREDTDLIGRHFGSFEGSREEIRRSSESDSETREGAMKQLDEKVTSLQGRSSDKEPR